MTFSIDGQKSGFYVANVSTTVHHEPLWSSPVLSDSSHTLVVTQGPTNANSIIIYLDYFLYTASANTALQAVSLFIDDADPRVKYDANWNFFGLESEFQHTSHGDPYRFFHLAGIDCRHHRQRFSRFNVFFSV